MSRCCNDANPPRLWVCCALPQEVRLLQGRLSNPHGVRFRVTGMGPDCARRTLAHWLERERPVAVLNCGFAGGLNPVHGAGTVLFATDDPHWERRLRAAGALPGWFTTSGRVLQTATEKAALWRATGADAVDMESEAIVAVCRAAAIPVAVVRAVSDPAGEDLPLDFSRFVRSDGSWAAGRLFLAIGLRPHRWARFLRLGRNARRAARQLAAVLDRALAGLSHDEGRGVSDPVRD